MNEPKAIKTGGIGSRQTSHLNLTVALVMPERNSNGGRHVNSIRRQIPVELRGDYEVLIRNHYSAKEARDIVLAHSPALHTLSR